MAGTRARGRTAFATLLAAGLLSAAPLAARAQSTPALITLHDFRGSDGAYPTAGLVQGSDGNFYGTTSGRQFGGNPVNDGTVFQLTPAGGLTTLHTFNGSGDGSNPSGELLQGGDGNFYGTTSEDGPEGFGTLFKITPAGALTTLYAFSGGSDGAAPSSSLIQGGDGNFYGTTLGNAPYGYGTIFRLTPAGALTTIYTFGAGTGFNPSALVRGGNGNFYGAADGGGSFGMIFEVTPQGVFTTLYEFDGSGGEFPNALALGSDGNFYGTTSEGGAGGAGTVFRLTPAGVLTTLYNFYNSNGYMPASALIQGADGNFYGTTSDGGTNFGYGTVFEITPAGQLTFLHTFDLSDGAIPAASLVQGSDGSFYGTATQGGANDYGTIFKVAFVPAFFSGEIALGSSAYYLGFSNGNYFGYYSFLTDPNYIYHYDLGYEYVFNANDNKDGVYLYDFASNDFLYTSPAFPFPYLYDFNLGSVVYYYPDPTSAGHYNTNGIRYFYVFNTRQIISK